MPLAIPPELKKIVPFVRRAEELDNDTSSPESRLVAYYCRQYAVHTGIPLSAESSAAKTCLGQLLEGLEAEKSKMDNFTKEEAGFLCRQFAGKIFDKADAEDRQGKAGKGTARTFYAAASFLEILDQFGEDHEEDRKKIIYAKWKATEILKALKEGRTPTPGGYGETDVPDDDEEPVEEASKGAPAVETVDDTSDDLDIPPAVIKPPTPKAAAAEDDLPLPPAYKPPPKSTAPPPTRPPVTFKLPAMDDDEDEPPPPMPPPVAPKPDPPKPASKPGGLFARFTNPTGKANKAQLADASELTKFAMAALEERDTELAAERLKQALEALGR